MLDLAAYLGILHSSFHLESLDLPYYVVSLFHFLWFLSVMIFLGFAGTHFLNLSLFACSLNLPLLLQAVGRRRFFVKFIRVAGGNKQLLCFFFLVSFLAVYVSTSISGEGTELCLSSISS